MIYRFRADIYTEGAAHLSRYRLMCGKRQVGVVVVTLF